MTHKNTLQASNNLKEALIECLLSVSNDKNSSSTMTNLVEEKLMPRLHSFLNNAVHDFIVSNPQILGEATQSDQTM